MAATTATPHAGQKLASGGRAAPQDEHTSANEAPQEAQKRASSAFAALHAGQMTTDGV
jgi:hypothetical protein